MLVALVDLGNLDQVGLIRPNVPLITSEVKREAVVEVAVRQHSFMSYTVLSRPEICCTIFDFFFCGEML